MTRKPPISTRIAQLLDRYGIPLRQRNNTLAQLLDLHYTSVQKKMNGQKTWTREQLLKICHHFAEPPSALMDSDMHSRSNAVLRIGARPQRCLVSVGEVLAQPKRENLVAVRRGDMWVVVSGTHTPVDTPCYRVLNIETLAAPRIASLDDDPEIPRIISEVFEQKGLNVWQFTQAEALLSAMRTEKFDGYVIDWVLSAGQTAEAIVATLRHEFSNAVPIVILTGELETHRVDESDLSRMVEMYQVSVHEKPARLSILASMVFEAVFDT
jgi:CheY-like chemotaxis protein